MANDPGQEVTTLLGAIRDGDHAAASRLFPLVYEELRCLAGKRMASERPNHTLQATALVHEAFLRLVDDESRQDPDWENRRHFFGAAAQAMRRILVEHARQKKAQKHGGDRQRQALLPDMAPGEVGASPLDLLALDEALGRLEEHDPRLAQLVMLRYFAGLSVEQTAQAMDLSPRTVKREWACARAWLFQEMTADAGASDER